MSVDSVRLVALAADLPCESLAGNIPGDETLFELVCHKEDQAAGFRFTLTAAYWTIERLAYVHLVAFPIAESRDLGRSRAIFNGVVALPFSGPSLQAALTWFSTKADDPTCTPCTQVYGEHEIQLDSGVSAGSGVITLRGTTAVP